MLIIDFETRSHCDLTTAGSYRYAADPTTEILCIGWMLHDDSGVVDRFSDLPAVVREYITDGGGLVAAWNAQFDRLLWERFAPTDLQLPLSRWYCLAAVARVNALPGGLNDCARAVFGEYRKDIRGAQLIKRMSIPPYEDTPELRQEMREYCWQDVKVSDDLRRHMRTMSQTEHQDYINSEVINDDGVEVDLYLALKAIKYAGAEGLELAVRLQELTSGEVEKHTQVQRIRDWVSERLTPEQVQVMTVMKKDEPKLSLDKQIRPRLLELADLPNNVKEVIEILDDGNKSSVAKFKRMVERADEKDRRVRGAFVFAGAGQTQRFASRGLQLHNFTRNCLTADETEDLIDHMDEGEPIDDCMATLSKALRPALVPSEGNVFIVGDWKGIEACALPWLADDVAAQERLDILADPEQDIYVKTQNALSLDSRQMGKVVELSMGYGGSTGAFKTMATAYGAPCPPEAHIKPMIVDRWRAANPWAQVFWDGLENAAKRAINNPGHPYRAGRVEYCYYKGLLGGTLVCALPGGYRIQYPNARIDNFNTEYGPRQTVTAIKANWKPAAGEKTWPRVSLWRGLLTENVTQAFCAALLRDCIRRLLDNDWPVVAHVHDEVVIEISEEFVDQDVKLVRSIMEDNPKWAKGLPLIADVKSMTRYGK